MEQVTAGSGRSQHTSCLEPNSKCLEINRKDSCGLLQGLGEASLCDGKWLLPTICSEQPNLLLEYYFLARAFAFLHQK